MKRLLSVALVLLMLLAVCPALAEGTLRVGMECEYVPFNWTQSEPNEYTVPIEGGMGYADGYDVQIAKKLAEGLGLELVIVKTEWSGLPLGVQSGMLDAVIAGMSPTEERKATMDFSDSYYTSQLVVVVRKDSPYAGATKLSDLAGATITGQLGTFHYTVIPQIPGVVQAEAMETFNVMTIATRAGAVDGYVAEDPGAQADVRGNPDLTYIRFAEGEGFVATEDERSIAIAVQKGSPLVEQINQVLAGIDQETRQQMMTDAIARMPLNQ
ncbi:MAG: transporter substrate-binding domain-containing protein [Clostridiales bacterium]|nr:transporter substrate-binding domain-containing protein [Clostridiales bacterium]